MVLTTSDRLTETDRARAAGFIRAFVAELDSIADKKTVYAELSNDSYPEIRVIKPVHGKPLTGENIIASASVIGVQGSDYFVFCTGAMIGCKTLSEATDRAAMILRGHYDR